MRSVCASWVDGLWLTSDESRAEYVKSWGSYDNGRQLIPGYYCPWWRREFVGIV